MAVVISTSIAHDLMKKVIRPGITEKGELLIARIAAGVAVCIAGYFGINPPGFVAQVVAFAFGLAASSFFPILVLGVFSKRATKEGAIAGMLTGIGFTASYIIYFRFIAPEAGASEWLFGISPEGIGMLGMLINFAVTLGVRSPSTKSKGGFLHGSRLALQGTDLAEHHFALAELLDTQQQQVLFFQLHEVFD